MSASTSSKLNLTPEALTAPPPPAIFTQLRSFAAGGVGGVCAVITGHPFDLVKVRLQTTEKAVYNGAIDCVRKTIAREGPIRVCFSIFLSTAEKVSDPLTHRVCTLVYLRHY